MFVQFALVNFKATLTIWHRERLWLTSFSSDRISISSFPSKAFILSCLLANLNRKGLSTEASVTQCLGISVFPLISHRRALFTLHVILDHTFSVCIQLNIITLIWVFLPLWVASADQQEPPWPPLSSACHWSPPQRLSHGPLYRAPSRFLSTLLILPHPTRWPSSSLLGAHFGCSPGWVLLPHHGGLKIHEVKHSWVICVFLF